MLKLIGLRGRRLLVLAVVASAVSFVGEAACGQKLSVPEDASLSVQEYVDLGVPDPSHEWTANEYEQALRALGEIPRSQLPRAGSSRSQFLFDRLLMSYARAFDLAYESPSQDETTETTPPHSLPALYSTARRDGLLFDRELVAIRSRTLARSLKTLPTRAQLAALAGRFAERMASATSEAERTRISGQVARAEETATSVADQLKRQAADLLAIAGSPEVQDSAREELLKNAEDLFPQLSKFLPDGDVRWIASLLRGAASPDFNAVIRPGLLRLAEQFDASDS